MFRFSEDEVVICFFKLLLSVVFFSQGELVAIALEISGMLFFFFFQKFLSLFFEVLKRWSLFLLNLSVLSNTQIHPKSSNVSSIDGMCSICNSMDTVEISHYSFEPQNWECLSVIE